MKQRVIRIDEVLKYLWNKKKIVLIILVIIAVFCGGISFVKAKNMGGKAGEKETVSLSVDAKELSDAQNIYFLEEQIREQKEYYKDSILMHVDAYHKPLSSVTYCFDYKGSGIDEENKVNRQRELRYRYVRELSEPEFFDFVREKTGKDMTNQYIAELTYTETPTENCLVVNSTFSDKEGAVKLTDIIEEYFNKNKKILQSGYEDFRVTEEHLKYNEVFDQGLRDNQNNQLNTITNYRTALETARAGAAPVANEYLNAYKQQVEEGNSDLVLGDKITFQRDVQAVGKKAKLLFMFKFVLKGLLAALLGIFCVVVVVFACTPSLISEKDFSQMYGVKLIQYINKTDAEDVSKAVQSILANLKEHKKLLLFSDNPNELSDAIIEKIRKELEEEGVKSTICRNDCGTTEFVKEVRESEAMILVGKKGVSRYKKLGEVLKEAKSASANIVGGIVIG